MKNILCVFLAFAVTVVQGETEMQTEDPIAALNQTREWTSFNDVYRVFSSIPMVESKGYGFEEELAVASGLRSFERVLESLGTAASGSQRSEALQTAVGSHRSLIDVAIIGTLASLGETAKFQPDRLRQALAESYSSKEIAEDVLRERENALKALDVLLRMRRTAGETRSSGTR